MTDSPLVSILTPCYNVEKFLPQCLDSIINQTYSNLQIVLVDDGSKDDTWRVMQDYAAKDSRIEIYHQENQGVSYTRNQLLGKIKGDYFLFIDSDDWIEPNMIEYLATQAKREDADMVTCDIVVNDRQVSYEYEYNIYNKEETVKRFLYHLEFRGSLCNKFCRSTLLHHRPSFQQDISFGEDALFCWELLKEADRVVYTNRQLYHYRMIETSLTHSAFGPKKLSAHKVWSQLCEETQKLHPEFLDIARARFCIETTLLLRDAAHCGYKEMNDVKMLQNTIKKYWNSLNKVNITSIRLKIYSLIASRCYWVADKL